MKCLILFLVILSSLNSFVIAANDVIDVIGSKITSQKITELTKKYKLQKKLTKGQLKIYSDKAGITLITDNKTVWRVILTFRLDQKLIPHKGLPIFINANDTPKDLLNKNGKPNQDSTNPESGNRSLAYKILDYNCLFIYKQNKLLKVFIDKVQYKNQDKY